MPEDLRRGLVFLLRITRIARIPDGLAVGQFPSRCGERSSTHAAAILSVGRDRGARLMGGVSRGNCAAGRAVPLTENRHLRRPVLLEHLSFVSKRGFRYSWARADVGMRGA
jgi:hypothetical protein